MDRGAKTVGDVMHRDFVTISASESLEEARHLMRLARLRHLLVERDGILVGIVSYRDIQDQMAARHVAPPVEEDADPYPGVGVEEAMLRSPFVVTPETELSTAASRMCHLGMGCLPVVERAPQGPRLVGVVTESDLIRAAYPVS